MNVTSNERSLKARIIFALKSPGEYLCLMICAKSQRWTLQSVRNYTHVQSICEVVDPSLRPGLFYSLLIQIRSRGVSIDINEVPTFTGIKIPNWESMAGLLGVMSKVVMCICQYYIYPLIGSLKTLFSVDFIWFEGLKVCYQRLEGTGWKC